MVEPTKLFGKSYICFQPKNLAGTTKLFLFATVICLIQKNYLRSEPNNFVETTKWFDSSKIILLREQNSFNGPMKLKFGWNQTFYVWSKTKIILNLGEKRPSNKEEETI